MVLGELFKIDTWWKFVLICGVLLSAAAFIFDIRFIDRRFVLGLGIGMVFIGVGHWMALRYIHEWADGGYYTRTALMHNKGTKVLIGFGSVISIYFFVRIMILLAV